MKKFNLAIYSQYQEVIYSPASTSQLARVPLDFLRECEQEGLIRSQRMAHGEYGYRVTDIRQLARIRRLHENLALDLAAIDVILNMHQRASDLMEQLKNLDQQKINREQELLSEAQELRRRLADEVDWTANN